MTEFDKCRDPDCPRKGPHAHPAKSAFQVGQRYRTRARGDIAVVIAVKDTGLYAKAPLTGRAVGQTIKLIVCRLDGHDGKYAVNEEGRILWDGADHDYDLVEGPL